MEPLKRRRNDILLVLALLLLAGGLWLALRAGRSAGGYVVVAVDGTETARLPLDRDGSYTWTGEAGTNTLTVRDGAASMESADCPDRLCVRQGAVRYEGESIVCLPHRLTATVAGGEDSGVDIVSK